MKLFPAQQKESIKYQVLSIKGLFNFLKLNAKRSTLLTTKGFTLIELLVVIGILGILAAALVATIDPFEQLKKANDAKIKNLAVEFQTANVRYYTTHGTFPWSEVTPATGCGSGASFSAVALNATSMLPCLGAKDITYTLIGEGELKTAFTTNLSELEKVKVTWVSGDASNMTVCFSPTSKSQKSSKETIYLSNGDPALPANCPKASAVDGTCFWCTK